MTIENRSPPRLCQKCALQGIASPIHLFQINDDEALLMCKNVDCTFMPSSNWESLIVKRNISDLTVPGCKKSYSSASSSQLSTESDRNILNRRTTKPVVRSRSSTPGLTSSLFRDLFHRDVEDTTVPANLPVQKPHTSPVGPEDSLPEATERKTLVPIAPFLSGHAHSFSSFETSKLAYKLQSRGAEAHRLAVSSSEPGSNFKPGNRILVSNQYTRADTRASTIVGSKRRACSIDSDSFSSSSSSFDSRPATPVETGPKGKKVKHIVVPPETLSRLLDGSLKLEIRKSDVIFRSVKQTDHTNKFSQTSDEVSHDNGKVKVCRVNSFRPVQSDTDNSFRPVKSDTVNSFRLVQSDTDNSFRPVQSDTDNSFRPVQSDTDNSFRPVQSDKDNSFNPAQSHTDSSKLDTNSAKESDSCSRSDNLEIRAVGSLHDIIKSGDTVFSLPPSATSSSSVQSHIEAINFQLKADSIRSHVEAINAHIHAINNAVGRSDLCSPVDFSYLCQKFGAEARSEQSPAVISEENQLNPVSCVTDRGDVNPSQINSFVPVGYLNEPAVVSDSESISTSSCKPHSEGFSEQLASSSHAFHLTNDTDFSNQFNGHLEGRL